MAVLRSLRTGLYCRLAIYTGDETLEGLVVARPPPSRQQARSVVPPPPRGRAARSPPPPQSAAAGARLQGKTAAAGRPPRIASTSRSGPPVGAAKAKAATLVLWGMLGDQATAATGTVFRYTVSGLDYQGEPMRARGLFYPLLWSNSTNSSSPADSTGGGLVVTPAPGEAPSACSGGALRTGCAAERTPRPSSDPPPALHTDPPLLPGVPNYIAGNGVCRVDSATTYMYCPLPGGNGSTVEEQFVPVRPDGSSAPIPPSQPTFLKSEVRWCWCWCS